MGKRLLIFGGGGFVGGHLSRFADQKGWDVSIVENQPGLQADWLTADISNKPIVDKVIRAVGPDAVVNVAAIADIDQAEQNKELAYKVNVEGARNVAEACANLGIRYTFFSSDAVFDGSKSSYTEDDEPSPINYYGWTKMEAEKAVLAVYPKATIARISLVLGFPVLRGNSFFAGLMSKLTEGKSLEVPIDEIRTPVDVLTLSECVLELCESNFSGVLQIGATDSISRFDLSRKLAKLFGFDDQQIQPQAFAKVGPGRAPRHKNGIISVVKARRVLRTRLLSTELGIQRALGTREIAILATNKIRRSTDDQAERQV